ncbi:hypothetical protein [Actinokineospora sp. NPDC004072]
MSIPPPSTPEEDDDAVTIPGNSLTDATKAQWDTSADTTSIHSSLSLQPDEDEP